MALPKIREQIEARVKDTGDTMTGRLVQTLNGNPCYELNDGTNRWFFQAIKADNASYIGPTSTKALKIDIDGNAIVKGSLTVDGSIIGSIQEAIKATQDGNGNIITSTYVPFTSYHAAGVDFNKIINSGFHRVANGNLNNPGSEWGQLLVMHGGGDTITQIYGAYGDGTLKTRSGNPADVGGTGSWTEWKTLLDSSNYTSYTVTKSGTGATGTWPISISGNAATATSATKAIQDGNGATIASTYLKLSGGTVTGATTFNKDVYINKNVHFRPEETVTSGTTAGIRNSICIYGKTYGNDATQIKTAGKLSYGDPGPQIIFGTNDTITSAQKCALIFTDNDTIATGCSLSLVATEAACAFIVPSDTAYTTYKARNIAANTSPLTSGSSSLASGNIYVQYE